MTKRLEVFILSDESNWLNIKSFIYKNKHYYAVVQDNEILRFGDDLKEVLNFKVEKMTEKGKDILVAYFATTAANELIEADKQQEYIDDYELFENLIYNNLDKLLKEFDTDTLSKDDAAVLNSNTDLDDVLPEIIEAVHESLASEIDLL